MTVFEIRLKVFLLKDIRHQDALSVIATFIDSVLVQHQAYLQWHEINTFKMYTFNSFFPVEKEGVYKKDQVYGIIIRTIKRDLAEYLDWVLRGYADAYMKGLTSEMRIIAQKHLEQVYSITPVMIKHEEGYWNPHLSFEQYEERIKNNLLKKYREVTQAEIGSEVKLWKLFERSSKMPIAIPYKGIKMLGDKLSIFVEDTPLAQDVMYMALGAGIGEMNPRGFGFVNFRYL